MTEDKRYLNGKIYKIINSVNDKCYVGSTTYTLNTRLIQHKSYSKISQITTSSILINEDPYNVSIQLIEDYPCLTKNELLLRERYWLENMECVNKKRPIITPEEKRKANLDRSKERIQCHHCDKQYNRYHKTRHYQNNHSQFDAPKYV